jgi:serpin B
MILAGAKKSSESEIKHVLDYVHYPCAEIHKNNAIIIDHIKSFQSEIDFKFLNQLFVCDGTVPNKEYIDLLDKYYKVAHVQGVNFADHAKSAAAMNDWVEQELKIKLHNRIAESVMSSTFKMILVNALYFKGNWFKKFDKHLTKPADFHLMDGSVLQVNMMHLTNRKFKFKSSAAGLSASLCEFSFVGQELSMSIILPNADTTLAVVESELTPEVLKDALEEYNFAVKVNVRVPVFRIEESSEVGE